MKGTWRRARRWLPCALVAPLIIGACQGPAPEPTGEALYKKLCATCHGDAGKGDGPAAEFLFPTPRNFTTRQFKVRTTPSGEMPTDEDILRTIDQGMPGSAMPGFSYLAEGNRQRLVDHVKRLARIETRPEQIIQAPAAPAVTPALLEQGRGLYGRMQCGQCHGEAGRGDGPAAATLRDDAGQPILPNDFTRGIYKGGGTVSDIYLRFSTGMNGTPMPSYEDSLGEADRFALAHYVKSLGPGVAVQPSTGIIEAGRAAEPLPSDPRDRRWDAVAPATVPLMLLWQRNTPAADSVSVRALHDGSSIALLIEWDDPDVSSRFRRDRDFHDAAAVMFSLSPELPIIEQPHFAMGEKGRPVNIWYWSLDRRAPLAEVTPPDPAAMFGSAPFGSSGVAVGRSTPSGVVEDLNAEQFRTVTPQPSEHQNVRGRGTYTESGRWRVVFTRQLESEGASDAELDSGAEVPIAFAVWNGSQQERNGRKAISTWYRLRLE